MFDQTHRQIVDLRACNPNGDPTQPTHDGNQPLPLISHTVGPLPSIPVHPFTPSSVNSEALETSRDVDRVALSRSDAIKLLDKQEHTSPTMSQSMNQTLGKYFPSHHHFVPQDIPGNVNTPTPPFLTSSARIGEQLIMNNLFLQQQQMSQPTMVHTHSPQQHEQQRLLAPQQAHFQPHFQNQMFECVQRCHVVTNVTNCPTLQGAGAVAHVLPNALSQESIHQSGVGMDDNRSCVQRPHKFPEDQKDDKYWEKRRKNNDSARRSRQTHRKKSEQLSMRVVALERENLQLKAEIRALKSEVERTRNMRYE